MRKNLGLLLWRPVRSVCQHGRALRRGRWGFCWAADSTTSVASGAASTQALVAASVVAPWDSVRPDLAIAASARLVGAAGGAAVQAAAATGAPTGSPWRPERLALIPTVTRPRI